VVALLDFQFSSFDRAPWLDVIMMVSPRGSDKAADVSTVASY
jgi:hypothetical protein